MCPVGHSLVCVNKSHQCIYKKVNKKSCNLLIYINNALSLLGSKWLKNFSKIELKYWIEYFSSTNVWANDHAAK